MIFFRCSYVQKAVSYTHLDVYKRQVPAFDPNRIAIKRGKLVTEGLPELDTAKKAYFHRFEDVEEMCIRDRAT